MTADQIDAKVVSRIHKLLALARDGGATEHEANAAMQMAQEQMLKYNLSMATIEATGSGASEGRTKDKADKNLMYPWKRELLRAIAAVNFVHVELLDKRTKSGQYIGAGYELIGRVSNVVAVRTMFEYLLQTIERLVVEEVGLSPQDRYTRFSHSFRLGASQRLQDRLQERHEKQMAEQARAEREQRAAAAHPASPTHNALVVVMADYEQAERDANNDLRWGFPAGQTARQRAEREAHYAQLVAEQEAKLAELRAQHPDLSGYECELIARGISPAEAAKIARPKPQTEAQRAKEKARDRRNWEAYQRRQERRSAKIDWQGFRRGTDSADSVSLDQQIDADKRRIE
jgi:hypothetical protein